MIRTRPYLASITHDQRTGGPVGAAYVPRDAAERAVLHRRMAGQWSQYWPTPLTPCTPLCARKAAA